MKFKFYEQNQTTLFPSNVGELVPENNLVRAIDTVVEQLDLRELYNSYSEEGQPAYHAKMLTKILLYGYAIGERSSRKLSSRLEYDVFFMYLSGLQRPDFRTISDFRKNKTEYLKRYFKQVLLISRRLGLASLGHISYDGTKMEANASRRKLKEKDELLRLETKIEQKIKDIMDDAERIDEEEDEKYGQENRGDELPKELRKKEKLLEKIKQAKKYLEEQELERVNITEPETRIMKTNNSGKDICYNAQAVVDSDNQIIVACKVINEEADNYQLKPMYEETISNTSEKPKEVSADAGYYSGKTYLFIEKEKINAYVPDSRFNSEVDEQGNEVIKKYDRRNFKYKNKEDSYKCPEGKKLSYKKSSSRNGVKFRIYEGNSCKQCKVRGECISKESANNRQIQIYENDDFKAEMRAKLLTKEGREKYKKRMVTVEPVFAHMKRIMNFNRFLLRGVEKVNLEFSLLCTAYNIKKLSKNLNLLLG
jgi:transposase